MKWTTYGADDRLALEFTPNFNEYSGGFLVDPDATPGSDFAVSIGSGGSRNTVYFERPSAGAWHYYAFVIDAEAPAASEITPYVDGKTVAYTKTLEGSGAGDFAESTLFWMSRDASSLFGAGNMQDLAIYEGQLSKTTILHHYETGTGIPFEPKASFNFLPVSVNAGVPVHLDASGSSSPAGPISDYSWDFDGSKEYGTDGASSPTISHTFSTPGTYTVDLRVKDETGATGTISHTITVGAALPPYQQTVEETAGIFHFWPMDEGTGAAFVDLVGGANAALAGGVTLGESGGVLSDSKTSSAAFDGSTGAASASVDLSGTHELTVEFWMKWSSYAADDRLALEFTPNFNEYTGGFLVDPDATPGTDFAVSIGSGTSRNTVYFERPTAGAWHYYAFVINTEAPAETEITPYVDGKSISYTKTESGTGAGDFADSTLYWMSRDASSLFGAGTMQDLALYTAALSASTIERHYEIGATDLENTSEPTISGSAEDEQTVTADAGSWNGIEPISYKYQWESCDSMGEACVDIPGATESSYTVIPREVGETLRVIVTASDSSGTRAATSEPTGVIVAAPPANKVIPTLSGTAEEGHILSASFGAWDGTPPLAYTYQWRRCNEDGEECLDVEGADGSTYKLEADDVGDTLRVAVTASNEVAAVTTQSAATAKVGTPVTLPANLVPPEISGTAQVGQALTASAGTWAGTPPLSYAYQWETCDPEGESCAEVVGATEASYSPIVGDVGKALRVVVGTSNGDGHASRISSPSAIVEAASLAVEANPCTDTWVGPVFGLWEEVSNWSTGSLPTGSDVACIPLGDTVSMFKGKYEVGTLYDEGALQVYGNGFLGKPRTTFGIANTSLPSRVGDLFLEGTLEGPGTLDISGELESDNGVFSGPGGALIGPAASGIFDGAIIEGYTVTNEGAAIYASGQYMVMSADGATRATLINKGIFEDNGAEIESEEGGGEVINTGIFEKNKLSETSIVAAIFTNDGVVATSVGNLSFIGGGAAGQASTGSWNKEGTGEISLWEGEFTVGEAVNLDEVAVHEKVATVTRVDAPASVLAPSLTGSLQAGQTLHATTGSWSGAEPISYEYEWQRCSASGGECAPVLGAEGSTFTLSSGEIGATIRVVVTAVNAYGRALAGSTVSDAVAAPPAPSNTTAPAISGIEQDGQKLVAGTGSWSAVAPIFYAYQWERCNASGAECVELEGEDGSEYEVSEGDIGATLKVVVTASNPGGSTEESSASTSVVGAEPTSELQRPRISGTLDVHDTLVTHGGVWTGSGAQLRYQWESCDESGDECAPIEGATSAKYDLTEGDQSTTVRVRVGVDGTADSVSDTSAATQEIAAAGTFASVQAPTISGTLQVGQGLTSNSGVWSGTGAVSYSYQWQSCDLYEVECSDIEGATQSTYVPVSGDAGNRLRVLVTATDESSHKASRESAVSQPVAKEHAPVAEQQPEIAGAAISGDLLTATTGVFAIGSPSYSYQWERCAPGNSCEAIAGATLDTYTVASGDLGDRIRVLVKASDSEGSTTAVSAPTSNVATATLTELTHPSISGVVQSGGTLSADPGIWSGSGPVSYAYQWEKCNVSGEDCSAIEGAEAQTYVPSGDDLGSTYRITVTVTNPLGSKTAVSSHTLASPGGEASVEEAQETAKDTDPAVIASSTSATLEGQSITPALSDEGEELASQNTLTTSTISKETAGEFAINTPVGELSFAPVETSPDATTPPTIVNGSAALFANTWPATDTIIRAEPLGVADLLQLRSNEAADVFSWEARLGPDQELEQLSDGSVAVVEASEETAQPSNSDQEVGESGPLRDTSEGPPETSEEKEEAEKEEAEPETEEEVPLESLPASPETHPATGEAGVGQPEPQQTLASYESAKAAMSGAETQTNGKALMVMSVPTATDAEGRTVPAKLTVVGDTITLTIAPGAEADYPLLVDAAVAAPSDKVSEERDPVKYGLSDQSKEKTGHIDEHIAEDGHVASGLDPNLKDGPLKIKTARLVVPYDVVTAKTEYAKREKAHLEEWLAKVGKAHLQPFITISKDYERDPCKEHKDPKCVPPPSVAAYKKAVGRLMDDLVKNNARRGFPPVELWGAWNEPDAGIDPLHHKEGRAARYWEAAESDLAKLAKHCPGCTVIAGEFAYAFGYEHKYTEHYRNMLIYGSTKRPDGAKRLLRSAPTVWSFHDYHDVVERKQEAAAEFAQFTDERVLGKPRLFMSEAGVELLNDKIATRVHDGGDEVELKEHPALQAQAAETFTSLHTVKASHEKISRMDREYYYMYSAPTEAQMDEGAFDSALLEAENGQRHVRPAYCVLGFYSHICPPTVESGPQKNISTGDKVCEYSPSSVEISGSVNPNGAKVFSYEFEYGVNIAGGKYEHVTMAQNDKPTDVWNAAEVHTTIPVTAFEMTEHGTCPSTIHYRLVAKNVQGLRNSSDQTVTFGGTL